MAALQPPARRRRRPRRGSLERPVNAPALPRVVPRRARCRCCCSLAFTVTQAGARCQAPTLPPAFDARRRRRPRARARHASTRTARPAARARSRRRRGSAQKMARLRPADADDRVARVDPGPRHASRLQNVMAVVEGPVARRDRRDGAPRRHRRRAGRERQRERDGGAARARPHLRAAAVGDADGACSRRTRSSSSRPTPARSAASARCASRDAPPRAGTSSRWSTSTRSPEPGRRASSSPATGRARRRPTLVADRVARGSPSRRAARPEHPGVVGAADRPRLPVHALRAGPVRRARDPRDHADDLRRAARRPSFGDSAGRLARAQARAARPLGAGDARIARPAASSWRRGRRATSGSASGSCAAGRSSWC